MRPRLRLDEVKTFDVVIVDFLTVRTDRTGGFEAPWFAARELNIVSRVVIEGSAERGANGAAIKMYMRVSSLFVFTAP